MTVSPRSTLIAGWPAYGLGVRLGAGEQADAGVPEIGVQADVRHQSVDGRVVELPVAGAEHAARGRLDCDAHRVRDRVRHPHELEPELPELDRLAFGIVL